MRAIIPAVLLISLPLVSIAQSQNRAQTWEWSVAGLYQGSESSGSTGGLTLDVSSEFGLGFNISYNFTNQLSVGLDVDYLKPDYLAVLIEDAVPPTSTTINHEFTQFNTRIKGTFNLMDAPLTPYLEAGLGWTFIDSNVASGPPITGCWWHPYWGYICSNYYNTFTETAFTYGAGVGVRYAIPGGSFIKISYNTWELDGVGATDNPTISAGRVEFGWGF